MGGSAPEGAVPAEESPAETGHRHSAERLVGMLTANVSLVVAALFYMGWAYSEAILGYFQLNPLDLQFGATEYVLRSSVTVFSPLLVLLGALWAVVLMAPRLRLAELSPAWVRRAPVWRWGAAVARRVGALGEPLARRRLGLLLLLAAGALLLLTVWDVARPVYSVLALTGVGVVLLTRPGPEGGGPVVYAVGLVVAAACALWAAGLYASEKGTEKADDFFHTLSRQTSVVIYSEKTLALSGPGVTVEKLPGDHKYGYRYGGLRLLLTRSGTYYLLPAGWRPGVNATHLIKESDDLRIELIPGR